MMSGGLFGNSAARGGDASASAALEAMTLDPHAARGSNTHNAAPAGTTGGTGVGIRRTLSVPKEFLRLLELDSASLSELLLDKETFARFLHGTEGASEARAFSRDLRLEIESMARANISLADEAHDLRSQICVIRAVDMKPVEEAYERVKKRTEVLAETHDIGVALRVLKERAMASDRQSEDVHEKWLAGDKKGVDAFVSEFRALREKYHEDTIKASIVEPSLGNGPGGGNPPPPPPTRGYPGRPRYG